MGGQWDGALLGVCGEGPGSGPEREEAGWRNGPGLPVGGFGKVGAHRGWEQTAQRSPVAGVMAALVFTTISGSTGT